MIKICAVCGKEFDGRGNRKTCGGECQMVLKKTYYARQKARYARIDKALHFARYLLWEAMKDEELDSDKIREVADVLIDYADKLEGIST